MQVNQPGSCIRPLTEVEKLQMYVHHMRDMVDLFNKEKENFNHVPLLESILAATEIVHNMDYANDFYQVGGFSLMPGLLEFPEGEIRAATAELLADLLQNNSFCQGKFLETGLTGVLLKLMKEDEDKVVRIKALYALSCLCRSNREAVECLLHLDGLPHLIVAVQSRIERMRTKAAFFLGHLVALEPSIMDILYDLGFVEVLIGLVKEGRSFSLEHLLNVMQSFAEYHEPSRVLIGRHGTLHEILEECLTYYEGKDEYQESKEYILRVLELCFL